jgi:outer membrane protein assembly factor BamB
MKNGRIYCYSPAKFLLCLDAKNGSAFWENSQADLLEAIGPDWKAQLYVTGYSTSTFIKCNDRQILFAGPQRTRMVAVSAEDGQLVWQKPFGNYQLVLRDDALYAAGPQQVGPTPPEPGLIVKYETGEVLGNLPMRRACTRASGSVDSLFYRTPGGTVRYDLASAQAKHIAPMRPPCQDGVIISDGHLYWGPWMCGCQLSLYGHICLGPAGDFNFRPGADDSRLETAAGDAASVAPLEVDAADWPAYQADNGRSSVTPVAVAGKVDRKWSCQLAEDSFPTAPVAVEDLVFVGDRKGIVRALNAADGEIRWQAYTAGPIYFPPAVEAGRLFVGSADGRVYAFEAATGRKLWSFRAAPVERWIPVYGKLISTWPVAGGVVVEDGTVYAAAGIAHYDGTHVYALDAVTGKIKWYNDRSGTVSEQVDSGVSLQGNLYLAGDELCFLGGGVHEIARCNKQTGKCLNEPVDQVQSQFHTSFYAYFPTYGKYVSLDYTLADGKRLEYDATYEGSRHGDLALLPPLGPNERKPYKPVSRWGGQQRRGQGPETVWQVPPGGRYNSFVIAPKTLLAAGHTGLDGAQTSFLAAINLADGSEVWRQALPGAIVKGGTAVNRDGRILVSLENDRVVCFGGAE